MAELQPLNRLGDFLRDQRQWYQLPQLFAMVRLIEIRNELRAKNLVDTEEPALSVGPPPANLDPALRQYRTLDGTYDDLTCPPMGAANRRFGRNVPLEFAYPDTDNLLVPNPRVVSRELMTRDTFKPATILNLLAAAWIQFMVHDWFVHNRSTLDEGIDIPLAPGDDWSDGTMRVPRSVPDPAPAGSTRPPAYTNPNSHWWDASQVYGCEKALCDSLRAMAGGKLKLLPSGLLPLEAGSGIDHTGFTDNWWIGLAMLHTLFAREHNYLCDQLAAQHPTWTDEQLYETAKLINSAMIAKIHRSSGRRRSCPTRSRSSPCTSTGRASSTKTCSRSSSSSARTNCSAASSARTRSNSARRIR